MAGLAVVRDTSMIKDVSKILSVMAQTTVFGSETLMCYRIRCCYGINASAGIVARITPLYRCINQAVVENATGHFESHNAMACFAIDVC